MLRINSYFIIGVSCWIVVSFWVHFHGLIRSGKVQNSKLRFENADPRIHPVLDSGIWRLPTPFSTENTSVPQILHQTFSSEMIYKKYVHAIASCLSLNPGWKYYLWRDSDAEALISQHYPHFLQKYKNYRDNLEKADSIRYIVLHHFGGIYLDMDVECRRPLFPTLSRLPAFVDQERTEQSNIVWSEPFCAMNSAMGSVPEHPFFKLMIDSMLQFEKTGNALYSTGPFLLTQKYKEYSKNVGARPVAIMDPRVFSPQMDSVGDWKKLCKSIRNPIIAQGCRTLVNKNWSLDDSDYSTIAVHRFLHLGSAVNLRGSSVNLTRIFPKQVTFYLAKRV